MCHQVIAHQRVLDRRVEFFDFGQKNMEKQKDSLRKLARAGAYFSPGI